ncbi:MAG TPA: ChaN family lipoprotein, partial [Longimicrobiales bacterium]|nr:ChaN family lipoprotein [Longimicrobiales bacterium]
SLASELEASDTSDVLLVGERHDDLVGHAVERELFRGALERAGRAAPPRDVVLSLEMFERDVQIVVDEYLAGLISEEHFIQSARAWDEYRIHYRQLVELAKERGVPVVAANAPRRYVNLVAERGPAALEELSDAAKAWLPPLPYPPASDRYRAEWERVMAQAADSSERHDADLGSYALDAQALWDAAMGHAIALALVRDLGALVLHVAGSFHIAHGTGIPERIVDYRPGTRVTTVVIEPADDPAAWDPGAHAGLADFVVLTATRARL